MAAIRLTSVSGSSVPNPKIWLTSVAGNVDAGVKTIRLTSVAGNTQPVTSSAVVRLTSVEGASIFQGEAPVPFAGDLDVASAEVGQFNGTEVTGGTIVSRSWTQIAKTPGAPDLVLSDTTIANPTFTAPISATEYTYLFSYQVTDDVGLTGEDEVQVIVRAADFGIVSSGTRIPGGVRVPSNGSWV